LAAFEPPGEIPSAARDLSRDALNGLNMPRISRIDRAAASPEVAEVYDHFMKTRGNIPNMFRTAAHRPEIMRTMVAHFRAVMETGTVPTKLKELVIVRTTQINRCEY
jgi:alkylhydroperoxidase family enzyme